MKKTKHFKKFLAILLVILIVLGSIKFLIIKPKVVFADSTLGFNEGYGATVSDNNGNVTGTITNAVWKDESLCKIGKCLYFNGVSYVNFGDDSDLDFIASDNFTLEGWFRTPDITSGERVIINKYNKTIGSDGGYRVYMNSNGYLLFGIDDDAISFPEDYVSTSTTAFDDNKWHFFSAVKTGTTSITIFVDGIQYQTDSSISSTGTLSNTDIYIYGGAQEPSKYFVGFLDEVSIHNSAKTLSEIKTDMTGETPSRGVTASFGPDTSWISNGLVGYWKMDETSGNSVDSSGNGLTLTNNATTTFVSGKFGNGSEHIPASSQYLSTATTISGTKSVSFWTNPDSNTNYFVSLTSGAYITASSGTISATGFTNPKIFVNGVETTTIIADSWQLVTVTTEIAINANQFYVGRRDSNYYDGTLDEVRTYNRTLSPAEVSQLYNWAPGPVAHWKMDENTGTTTNDSSGNGNVSSAFTGNATWATGKYGSGITFDGVNDVVLIVESATTDLGTPTDSYTVSAWFKTTTDSALSQGIVEKATGGTFPFNLYLNNAEKLCFAVQDGAAGPSACYSAGSALNDGQWHYATGIRNVSTDRAEVYLDGKFVTYSTDSTTTTAVNDVDISIGNGGGSYVGEDFNGIIDDARIYNYARTPAQIIENMNGGHPAPGSPVGSAVAYWKFDEGALNTCPVATDDYCDSSINANGLAFSTTAGGFTNSGKFGKAYDGGDNLRAIRADDTDFDFSNGTDDFTLSLWFNRGGAISAQEYLLDKHTTNDGFTLYMDADGDIVCGIGDGTSFPEDTAGTTAANYDDTSWHHAVCVKQGTSSLTLYIDGKSVASDTSIAADADMSNAGKLILGDTNETDGTDEWLGDIDEVKIFRSALTSDQVKVLYNQNSASVMGALSTDSSGVASNASIDSYCPPGQGTACVAPVAEWKLDENTGTSAYDSSDNNLTNTLLNSPSWAAGKFGSAISFDGSDDNVQRVDDSLLNPANDMTWQAWVKIRTLPSTRSQNAVIIMKNYASAPNYSYRLLIPSSSNKAEINWVNTTPTNYNAISNTALSVDTWYFLTAVRNGGLLKIYINGVDDTAAGGGTPTGTLVSSNNKLMIGSDAGTSGRLDGYIDDIKIYNYARTQAQIAWDYNRGGPVGWWKMDENTGTAANDSLGNSTAGTLTNSPTWVTGKFNSGVSFAGSNQQILIADDSDFDFADDEDMTLTTWFKHAAASAQEVIMSKYAAAGYKIIMESDGDITCGLDYDSTWSPTDSITSTAATYDDGIWHHIACVKTGATSLALYIDGVLIATDSSITATNTLTNADPLYLGIDADGTSLDFTGSLDDVRIYRYPLTAQQIKTIMNNSSAVKY